MDSDSPSNSPFIVPRKYLRVSSQKDEIESGECYFESLPCETVLNVLSFLEAKDLSVARLVTKGWNVLANDKLLWKNLCESEFNVHQRLGETWRETYYKIEELFSEGSWEGMSKWMEPTGYDSEQKTTATLHFLKRNEQLNARTELRAKESGSSKEEIRSFNDAPFKITGFGVTINCSSPSQFRIEGIRTTADASGCTFQWNKHFERHTSIYNGHLDLATGSVTGTIDYNDGSTNWKGVFFYTKSPRAKHQPTKNKDRQINA